MIMRLQSFLLILNRLCFRGNDMDLKTARREAIKYGLTGPDWLFDLSISDEEIRQRIGSDGG